VGEPAHALANMTISVVAVSIVVHGVTAQPLLDRYEHTRRQMRERLQRRAQRRAAARV
jgi:NhaP-type Na+/H+ or K+/H+ antiporter